MSDTYTPLRWGILGAGSIANRFSSDVKPLADHKLLAVGSRDATRANTFADKYGVPNRHTRYEDLVADPEVDVVYVATPHNFHKEHALLALDHGKAVLCEKPFTINRGEAEVIVKAARAKNLFVMEGMWSRCFPIWAKVRAILKEGAIGKPRLLIADFGFGAGKTGDDGKLTDVNPKGRLFDRALGGGALMDVGVYPVSLAHMLFGTPDNVAAVATLGHTGVDENTGMLLHFPDGAVAVTCTSIQTTTPFLATILGSSGSIEVHSPWWRPNALTLHRDGQAAERIEIPFEGEGFQFEAQHVAACLRAGKKESDIIPLDESLAIMKTLDNLRAQIGLKYPME